jgi:hypothetical protein
MIGLTSFYNALTIILRRPYLVQGLSRNIVLNEFLGLNKSSFSNSFYLGNMDIITSKISVKMLVPPN